MEAEAFTDLVGDHLGLWLLSASAHDIAGRLWSANAPIASCENLEGLAQLLATAPDAPILLDAVYPNQDAEYLDARAMKRLGESH